MRRGFNKILNCRRVCPRGQVIETSSGDLGPGSVTNRPWCASELSFDPDSKLKKAWEHPNVTQVHDSQKRDVRTAGVHFCERSPREAQQSTRPIRTKGTGPQPGNSQVTCSNAW